jgi:cysteinyl-tRNA synthetase
MLQIYNTLTGSKQPFTPLQEGKVGLYACGITVYDRCHIGHARSMVVFDTIVRFFRYSGYEVTYVRNITDIDDKIIKRAAENGESVEALVARMIDIMHQDERALGLLAPNHEPRATQHIPQIITLIEKLIDNESAYVSASGDVCFSIESFKDYGKLSRRNVDQLLENTRSTLNSDKRNPLDFVLWKSAKPGEPQWPSPWGQGRPGWHIECSAMSTNILGDTFDIHGGGLDLKFPHHENEIAQSEAACGGEFARWWMHAGLLTINGQKMSKSLGNFVTIEDALKQYHAETIRCFMLSATYRSPLDYCENTLQQMHSRMESLYTALRGLDLTQVLEDSDFEKNFQDAMNDDFNTPIAMSVLFDLAHEINRIKLNDTQAASLLAGLLQRLMQVLGLGFESAEDFLQGKVDAETVAKIEALIARRNKARAEKDWAEADAVRDELTAMGIAIEDGSQGTQWRRL